MKFKWGFGMGIFGIGIAAALSVTACSKSDRSAASGAASSYAERLDLRVLGPDQDSGYPNRSSDVAALKGPESYIVQGNEIYFNDVITLSGTHGGALELFFVFQDGGLGVPILVAHYSHQVTDAENHPMGVTAPKLVGFDSQTRRWFIPLAEVLADESGDLTRVDASDDQVLYLELAAPSGLISITVHFRAQGPLPPLAFDKLDVRFTDTASAAQAASNGGIPIFRASWRNPTRRSLKLWLPGSHPADIEAGSIEQETVLAAPTYNIIQDGNYNGPLYKRRVSRATLLPSAVRIERTPDEGGPISHETLSLAVPGAHVEVGAHETATLTWLASPAEAAQNCAGPASGWKFIGLHLAGRFASAFALSEAGDSQPAASSASLEYNLNLSSGFGPETAAGEQFACQGYF